MNVFHTSKCYQLQTWCTKDVIVHLCTATVHSLRATVLQDRTKHCESRWKRTKSTLQYSRYLNTCCSRLFMWPLHFFHSNGLRYFEMSGCLCGRENLKMLQTPRQKVQARVSMTQWPGSLVNWPSDPSVRGAPEGNATSPGSSQSTDPSHRLFRLRWWISFLHDRSW